MLEQNNQEYILDQEDGFSVTQNMQNGDGTNPVTNAYIEYLVQTLDNSKVVLGFAILDEELGVTRDKILVSISADGQVIMIQQSKPHLEQVTS